MTATTAGPQAPRSTHWRIGRLARWLGLTTRTLRYWEELALVPAARRSPGGFRSYGPEHVRAARGVMLLKEAGFRLDDIQRTQAALETSKTARHGLGALDEVLERQAQRLSRSIARQQLLLDELRAARRSLGHCTGCDGKRFDDACMDCLANASCNNLPDALVSLMCTAAETKRGDYPS